MAQDASFDDLNWFIGSKSLDRQFDEVMSWLDDAPKDIRWHQTSLDTKAYRALDDGNEKLSYLIQSSPQVGVPITVLGELYYSIFLGEKREKIH